jgi:putative transcriptional regulator
MISMRWVLLAFALVITPAVMPDAALTQPDDTQQQDFLTGQLLIASPDMGDPRFAHAVILVVHHDRNGAFGLIVNRPVEEQDLARLLNDLGQNSDGVAGKIEVYLGGPVETQLGFVLHSVEYQRPETIAIDGKVAVTSSPEVLRDIAEKRGPQKFIFAFGYAGWGPGQLDDEMRLQAWFTAPDDPKLLFDDDRAKLWQDAISRRSRAL